jgi:hypothetical protein
MTVGDLMQEARRRAFRSLVLFLGIAAYAVALIYAGVHNYALLTRGVPPELIIFALLGLFGLEISAIALPLAVHFWTAPGLHRIAALAFYAVDAVPQRIVIYFTPKGEPHDGLLPASSTHGS